MILIAVVSENRGLGFKGKLLYHIPEDLRHFRQLTVGGTVVMGRKTLESLPGGRPLPDRKTIVLTRNSQFYCDGAEICHSAEELPPETAGERYYLCGGGEIYRLLLPRCGEAWITDVRGRPEADTFLPEMTLQNGWIPVEIGRWQTSGNEEYRFVHYLHKGTDKNE